MISTQAFNAKGKAETSLKKLKTKLHFLDFTAEEISEVCRTGEISESKLKSLTEIDQILLQLKLTERDKWKALCEAENERLEN